MDVEGILVAVEWRWVKSGRNGLGLEQGKLRAPVVGIGPQEITHRSFVWHLLHTLDGTNMVKSVNRWRQSAV